MTSPPAHTLLSISEFHYVNNLIHQYVPLKKPVSTQHNSLLFRGGALYVVWTADSVLIREVTFIQSVLYREVPPCYAFSFSHSLFFSGA